MKRVVGIDPGLKGAFCILTIDENPQSKIDVKFEPMPLIGSDIDYFTICRIFGALIDAHIFLEQVNAFKMGASSAFKFGRQVGCLEAMLHAHRIPFTAVTPQRWQAEMHQGIPKKSITDPKQRSLAAARRLFPEVNLLKTEKARFPDLGFVDSLLLAEYGRRQLFGVGGDKKVSPE